MNPQQFAQKIKAKYPQYNNLDDLELTQKIITKYPVYASQVQTDTGKKGWGGLATGVGKDAAKLVKGLGIIGEKILSPVAKVIGVEEPRNFRDLKIDEPVGAYEKTGALISAVAQFATPGGLVSKATKGLSFIPKILARATGDAIVQGARTGGDLKESAEVGGVSAGIQTGLAGLGWLGRLSGRLLKSAAGVLSGRGTAPIEAILKESVAAREGLKGSVSQTLKDDVKQITNHVREVAKQSQTNYKESLKGLSIFKDAKTPAALRDSFVNNTVMQLKHEGSEKLANEVSKLGQKTFNNLDDLFSEVSKIPGAVKNESIKKWVNSTKQIVESLKGEGKAVNLTTQGIKSKFTSLLREHSVEVNPAKKELEFLSSTLRKSEENVLKEVFGVVNKWKDVSPPGIDRLAVKIGNYVKPGEQSKQLNGILSSLKTTARNYLGDRVSGAKEMVARFREEQKFLSQLKTFLSAKNAPLDDPATLKNISSKLTTLFTKNKEIAREVLESIPGGKQIVGRQAGRELVEPIARSSASIGGLVQSLMQTVIPPKLVGEIVSLTGIARNRVLPVLQSLESLAPAERALILSLFSQNSQTSDQED